MIELLDDDLDFEAAVDRQLPCTGNTDPAIGHAEVCLVCGGDGVSRSWCAGKRAPGWGNSESSSLCEACDGVGWIGIDPRAATNVRPGSDEKIAVLAARYRAGLPLQQAGDLTVFVKGVPE